MTPNDNERQVVRYNLSDHQNQLLSLHQAKISQAAEDLTAIAAEEETLRKLYEAKQQTVTARRALHQAAVESQAMFLSYVIQEFKLPTPKEGTSWTPKQEEPGKYFLFAEVDEAPATEEPKVEVLAPSKPKEPSHRWKRKNQKIAVIPISPEPAEQTPA